MKLVTLLDRNGAFVGKCELPANQSMVRAIVWSQSVFVLDPLGKIDTFKQTDAYTARSLITT